VGWGWPEAYKRPTQSRMWEGGVGLARGL
jgi:hypothetical protein